MVAHVAERDPRSVLDVATGTAGVALALTRRTEGDVIGIDITEAMLRHGRERVQQAGPAIAYGSSSVKPNAFRFPTTHSTR